MLLMDYIDHFTGLPGGAGRGTGDQYDGSIKGLISNKTAISDLLKQRREGMKFDPCCLMDSDEALP